MTNQQELDSKECEEMAEGGEDKDCLSCSCRVCIAQEPVSESIFKTPTIEQVAWVFEKIVDNARVKGTFRKLIYDGMGFEGDAYKPLYQAGGMDITNMIMSDD